MIRTVTLTARVDTAVEITLDNLRIELIYPQDETAERFFRAAYQNPGSAHGLGPLEAPLTHP